MNRETKHLIGWAALAALVAMLALLLISYLSPARADDAFVVRDAQSRLQELGYSIRADGSMGQETRDAITDFQVTHGLKPTGNLDGLTFVVLYRHDDPGSGSGGSGAPLPTRKIDYDRKAP